jgi:hypothetical protein
MSIALAPAVTIAPTTAPPLVHIYCVHHGDPAKSLCGTPRNRPVNSLRVIGKRYPVHANMCVVCLDMAPRPCPECGG